MIKSVEKYILLKFFNSFIYFLIFKVHGCILKSKIEGRVKYFVYEGINDEFMVLYGCDENGVKNQHKTVCHWSTYDTFEIHKEVEQNF